MRESSVEKPRPLLPACLSMPRQAIFPARAAQLIPPAAKFEPSAEEQFRVLHVGCGPSSAKRLHPFFRSSQWNEVRLDIDASTVPDISGSIVDMRNFAEDESC